MHLRKGLRRWRGTGPRAAIVGGLVGAATAVAGDTGVPPPPFGTPTGNITDPGQNITAVRGDRLWEWTEQTRSEVLARHGVVATSQPLAAQAGLDMLKHGGNAVDAAGAAGGVGGGPQPPSAGLGGGQFSPFYPAQGDKQLRAEGGGGG